LQQGSVAHGDGSISVAFPAAIRHRRSDRVAPMSKAADQNTRGRRRKVSLQVGHSGLPVMDYGNRFDVGFSPYQSIRLSC